MLGHRFSKYDPRQNNKSKFDQLLDLFMQLLTYTSGDVGEAMNWLTQLDKEYQLTDDEYGIGDFIQELKDKGYIDEKRENGEIKITPKTEQGIRKRSLEEIFGKLKRRAITILSSPDLGMRLIRKHGPTSLATCWSRSISRVPSGMRRSTMALNNFNCRKTTWTFAKQISSRRLPQC